ncbi:AAA family ATPase, partial [Oscillospiraceae bacterium LCP21S3_A1]
EALNQGLRVLAYSGELPDYHFRRWLDMQLAGPQNVETSYNQFSDAVYRLPEDVTEQIGEWYRGRAYIYDNNAVDDEDAALLDTVEQAVCRYGINLVCIDNL